METVKAKELKEEDISNIFSSIYADNYDKIWYFMDLDEFVQECWVKFLTSTFDSSRASLSTYAYIVGKSAALNILTKHFRKKNLVIRKRITVDFSATSPEKFGSVYQSHEKIISEEMLCVADKIDFCRDKDGNVISGSEILKILCDGGNVANISKMVYNKNGKKVSKTTVYYMVQGLREKIKTGLCYEEVE